MSFLKKVLEIFGFGRPPGKRPHHRDYTITVNRIGTGCTDADFNFVLNPPGLSFANNNKPGFILFFDLVDGTNVQDCKFHKTDPLWVQNLPACPTAQCDWDQFESMGVINGGKTLIVRNRNDTATQFGFTIRIDVPGCGVVPYDPIGNNLNGPQ